MKNRIPGTKRKKGLFSGKADNDTAKREEEDGLFLLSLKDLDREQGQQLVDWEEEKILARALDAIRGYCCSPLVSQMNTDKFTCYGNFPHDSVTEFRHPAHVPEDALWARIHITGKQCVVGHIVRNVFYIVFLDKDHGFYKSKLRHT
jgi:hypothetical protein